MEIILEMETRAAELVAQAADLRGMARQLRVSLLAQLVSEQGAELELEGGLELVEARGELERESLRAWSRNDSEEEEREESRRPSIPTVNGLREWLDRRGWGVEPSGRVVTYRGASRYGIPLRTVRAELEAELERDRRVRGRLPRSPLSVPTWRD